MRYCIWNNKGGVGKTFLTYCLAVELALQRQDQTIVVADMCPQANVTEMLLGGNGAGEANLAKCYENNRTIASYIKSRYDRSRFGKIGDEVTYFVKVKDYNTTMPENLYLLPGDMDLDICAVIIDYLAQAPERGSWAKSRSFLDDLINVFEHKQKNKPIFLIDSNPSFANYTQLGLIAANRLIVPCTADSASIRGIFNVLRLVFGEKLGISTSDDVAFDTFVVMLHDAGLLPPKIQSFILNKSRTTDKNASAAYKSHVSEIDRLTSEITCNHPGSFAESAQTYNLKDCNTIAPVLSYIGIPPSALQQQIYDVYGNSVRLNQSQIDPFLEHIHHLVSKNFSDEATTTE